MEVRWKILELEKKTKSEIPWKLWKLATVLQTSGWLVIDSNGSRFCMNDLSIRFHLAPQELVLPKAATNLGVVVSTESPK